MPTSVDLGRFALDAAAQALDGAGVGHEPWTSGEGFVGLRIKPDLHGAPLNRLAFGLEQRLDGFSLLYSPSKLSASGSRGVVSAFHREIFASHQLVRGGRIDPITIHEIHHAFLDRLEEMGGDHLFLGSATSFNGTPISNFAPEQGGYFSYLSFQEPSAYLLQLGRLGTELSLALAEPRPDRPRIDELLSELRDMARWAWVLAGRTADVVTRALEHVGAEPLSAIFALKARATQKRSEADSPLVLWCRVPLPDVDVELPIPGQSARDAYQALLDSNAGPREPWLAAHDRLLLPLEERMGRLIKEAESLVEPARALEQAAIACLAGQGDAAALALAARKIRSAALPR